MNDLRSLSVYRGINIEPNWMCQTIDIHSKRNIPTSFANFRITMSKPLATSMVMKLHNRELDEYTWNLATYQVIIGSLMYAFNATQPDIAYAIGVLS